MRHIRSCAIVVVCASTVILLGALPAGGLGGVVPPRGVGPAPVAVLAATADPAATQLLDQALAAMNPQQRPCLETTVWQRVQLPHLEYESEGRYVAGTEHRYRMEFHTRIGDRQGSLLQVCDGSSLWQGTRPQAGPWTEVRRIRLETSAAGPVMPLNVGGRSFAFSGVQPLLTALRQQWLWVRQETTPLQDAECLLLTGVWQPALASALAPADKPWPEALPKQCRLWLDSRTLWPRRVEWLGEGSVPRRLVEMELRSPQFPQVLTAERCQAEFTFQPGDTPVHEMGPGASPPAQHEVKKVEKSVL